MSLFKTFMDWRASRYQHYLDTRFEDDQCPECHGRGYYASPSAGEFVPYSHVFDCEQCCGTGLYTKWTENL